MSFFVFNYTATSEIYTYCHTLSLLDALPISPVLVLDEPTAGVDIELRQQLWSHVRALNAAGTTVLLTTHYLEEAEELCRTEEHTSELQSLMRISYAVFCLKKKTTQDNKTHITTSS